MTPQGERPGGDGRGGDGRPGIAPETLAALTEATPSRIQRKLDKQPGLAEDWTWTFADDRWHIDTGKECVTLHVPNGSVDLPEQVRCTCLLSPKCLHLLAVVSLLSLSELSPPQDGRDDAVSEDAGAGHGEAAAAGPVAARESRGDELEYNAPHVLTAEQRAVAEQMWESVSQLLAIGARAAGVGPQSGLSRSIHACRSTGLHRLAAAGLRVLQSIRQLRGNDEQFLAFELCESLFEAARIAWRLSAPVTSGDDAAGVAVETSWIGSARRSYAQVLGLKFDALLTEPILTQTGYAGVVSYFADVHGEIATISQVRPGTVDDVESAWAASLEVGSIAASHQEAAGKGLLVQQGSRSDDGRLGAGQSTRAVLVDSDGWESPAVAALFRPTLTEQAVRIFERWASAAPLKAGSDLVYVEGWIIGADGQGTRLRTRDGEWLRMLPRQEDERLRYVENLRQLAHAPGMSLRIIGTLTLRMAGAIEPLAIAPWQPPDDALGSASPTQHERADRASEERRLSLPSAWGGRADLGLRRLSRSHFTASAVEAPWLGEGAQRLDDGLDRIRARLMAVAIGGRNSLTPRSISGLARESRQLERQLQPTAASLLAHLGSLAEQTQVGIDGLRFADSPMALGQAWLATACYESAARNAFQASVWREALAED